MFVWKYKYLGRSSRKAEILKYFINKIASYNSSHTYRV